MKASFAVADAGIVLDVAVAGVALHRLAGPGPVEHQVVERDRVLLVRRERHGALIP
jgi:hypothetical protein